MLRHALEQCAAVAELVDATDSKSVSGDRVGVRSSAAPFFQKNVEYTGQIDGSVPIVYIDLSFL